MYPAILGSAYWQLYVRCGCWRQNQRVKFDDHKVIVACADRTLKVYNMETKEQLGEHGGHLGPVTCLSSFNDPALTPGFTAITGSMDHSVKLWQISTQESMR